MARRKKAEALAKARAEREAQQTKAEQERVQRSVAGVNHLEIPAELAFILSKINGKELLFVGRWRGNCAFGGVYRRCIMRESTQT